MNKIVFPTPENISSALILADCENIKFSVTTELNSYLLAQFFIFGKNFALDERGVTT